MLVAAGNIGMDDLLLLAIFITVFPCSPRKYRVSQVLFAA